MTNKGIKPFDINAHLDAMISRRGFYYPSQQKTTPEESAEADKKWRAQREAEKRELERIEAKIKASVTPEEFATWESSLHDDCI